MNDLQKYGCIVALLLLPAARLSAQAPQMRGPALERVEQYKKLRLMETLKMDEETSIRFFARYDKHVAALRDIGKERTVLIDELEDLRKSNAGNDALEKKIQEIVKNEEKVSDERARFLQEIRGVLPVAKVADYIVFERNFNQNLREIMRDIARGRWNRKMDQ